MKLVSRECTRLNENKSTYDKIQIRKIKGNKDLTILLANITY